MERKRPAAPPTPAAKLTRSGCPIPSGFFSRGIMAKQTDDLSIGGRQVPAVAPAFSPPNSWVDRVKEPQQVPAITAPEEDKAPGKTDVGTLIIGPEISFVGEIAACKRLVVDGMVEATLQRCQELVVGERGFLKGQARTETAEV